MVAHLSMQNAAEHHHRHRRFHRVARHIGHADRQLTILRKILEEVAADVVGGNTAVRDVETLDLRWLGGHQVHLEGVGCLEFLYQFLD